MADENAPTQLYEKAHWLKPVTKRADRPTEDVPDGAQCFVSDNGEIYRFEQAAWVVVADED